MADVKKPTAPAKPAPAGNGGPPPEKKTLTPAN